MYALFFLITSKSQVVVKYAITNFHFTAVEIAVYCTICKYNVQITVEFEVDVVEINLQEQNVDLYMTFVDLTKAFDTVSLDWLWEIMAKFGCPPRYIAMVRQFHDGMQARVQNDGEYSEPFPVTNGVKQGSVMAPTLFSMMFSAMLTDAF